MNEKLEKRYIPQATVEVRAAGDGKQSIVGTAVPYEKLSVNLGGFVEKFERGAFGDFISDEEIIATYDHDTRLLLGRVPDTLKLTDEQDGVHYDIDPPDTSIGRDLLVLLARKDVRGSSFTFSVKRGGDEWIEPEDENEPILRVIKKGGARLWEVAPVVRPAYQVNDVSVAQRSVQKLLEEREVALREDAEGARRMAAARQRQAAATLES